MIKGKSPFTYTFPPYNKSEWWLRLTSPFVFQRRKRGKKLKFETTCWWLNVNSHFGMSYTFKMRGNPHVKMNFFFTRQGAQGEPRGKWLEDLKVGSVWPWQRLYLRPEWRPENRSTALYLLTGNSSFWRECVSWVVHLRSFVPWSLSRNRQLDCSLACFQSNPNQLISFSFWS